VAKGCKGSISSHLKPAPKHDNPDELEPDTVAQTVRGVVISEEPRARGVRTVLLIDVTKNAERAGDGRC